MSLERPFSCFLKYSGILGSLSQWICVIGIILNAALVFAPDVTILGAADVVIKDIRSCDNPDQYPSSLSIMRKKLNRTLESLDGEILLHTDIDDSVGINVNVAKWGDGGYKPNYYILEDDKVCEVLFKWVEKGLVQLLKQLDQPEECPFKKGTYKVKNYIVDYSELPKELVYGEFRITTWLIQNNENMMCHQLFVLSKPRITGYF